jgi:hypothetical protein
MFNRRDSFDRAQAADVMKLLASHDQDEDLQQVVEHYAGAIGSAYVTYHDPYAVATGPPSTRSDDLFLPDQGLHKPAEKKKTRKKSALTPPPATNRQWNEGTIGYMYAWAGPT